MIYTLCFWIYTSIKKNIVSWILYIFYSHNYVLKYLLPLNGHSNCIMVWMERLTFYNAFNCFNNHFWVPSNFMIRTKNCKKGVFCHLMKEMRYHKFVKQVLWSATIITRFEQSWNLKSNMATCLASDDAFQSPIIIISRLDSI